MDVILDVTYFLKSKCLQVCFWRCIPPDVWIAIACRSSSTHARRRWLLVCSAQLGDANPFLSGVHNVFPVIYRESESGIFHLQFSISL